MAATADIWQSPFSEAEREGDSPIFVRRKLGQSPKNPCRSVYHESRNFSFAAGRCRPVGRRRNVGLFTLGLRAGPRGAGGRRGPGADRAGERAAAHRAGPRQRRDPRPDQPQNPYRDHRRAAGRQAAFHCRYLFRQPGHLYPRSVRATVRRILALQSGGLGRPAGRPGARPRPRERQRSRRKGRDRGGFSGHVRMLDGGRDRRHLVDRGAEGFAAQRVADPRGEPRRRNARQRPPRLSRGVSRAGRPARRRSARGEHAGPALWPGRIDSRPGLLRLHAAEGLHADQRVDLYRLGVDAVAGPLRGAGRRTVPGQLRHDLPADGPGKLAGSHRGHHDARHADVGLSGAGAILDVAALRGRRPRRRLALGRRPLSPVGGRKSSAVHGARVGPQAVRWMARDGRANAQLRRLRPAVRRRSLARARLSPDLVRDDRERRARQVAETVLLLLVARSRSRRRSGADPHGPRHPGGRRPRRLLPQYLDVGQRAGQGRPAMARQAARRRSRSGLVGRVAALGVRLPRRLANGREFHQRLFGHVPGRRRISGLRALLGCRAVSQAIRRGRLVLRQHAGDHVRGLARLFQRRAWAAPAARRGPGTARTAPADPRRRRSARRSGHHLRNRQRRPDAIQRESGTVRSDHH